MSPDKREKSLQRLRKLGRITRGMEWCLKTDRGRGMTWQYCADQIGLPLGKTLRIGALLGLTDVKSKATLTKLERKASRPNHDGAPP
jgi:hypothetical protein